MVLHKQKKYLTRIGDLLDAGIAGAHTKLAIKRYELYRIWQSIMPEPIASQTKPIGWKGDVLIIETPNSVWSQEMTIMKYDIINRIKTHCPSLTIQDICFKPGWHSAKQPRSPVTKKSLSSDDQAKIEKWIKHIPGDELREAVRRAIEVALTRERYSKNV